MILPVNLSNRGFKGGWCGKKISSKVIDTIRAEFPENIYYQIVIWKDKDHFDEITELLKTQDYTDAIAVGGDGTVNHVAKTILNTNIRLGIVPIGSGNGLAFTAGIPKNPGKALEIIIQGEATYIDSFYINGQFSCMLCGLGLDAQVAHDFAKQKSRGLSTYVKQSIRNFFSAKAYPFTITTENISIHTHAFFISIANSNQFGNNVTIAPKASLSDGLLDIVVVNKMNKMKMIYSFARQVTSGKVQEQFEKDRSQKSIQYFQAKNIIIHNPGNAPLHIDGEPASTSEKFEIKIIERAFRLICKK